ncbi:hypothetical protein MNBD_DELTA03-1882, partial [hydrothermal vent metagenome]
PIFVRFALLTYRGYASEAETNEPGAHLNGYSYELRVILLPLLNGYKSFNTVDYTIITKITKK